MPVNGSPVKNWVTTNGLRSSQFLASVPNMKIFILLDHVNKIKYRSKRGDVYTETQRDYIFEPLIFTTHGLFWSSRPLSYNGPSFVTLFFLRFKYTWPPFKTFNDLWWVISMILYFIECLHFFTVINHKSPSWNNISYEKVHTCRSYLRRAVRDFSWSCTVVNDN